MSKYKHELRIYANEQLMSDYNTLMMRIKAHLFHLGVDSELAERIKNRYPKPSNEELDEMMYKVFHILRQDSKPMIPGR